MSDARSAAQASRHHAWQLVARRLPADARARCVCVSRSLRDALRDPHVASFLDLSAGSGVTCAVNDVALRAAAAVAGGKLQTLDVRGRPSVSLGALVAVAAANADTLRELRLGGEGTIRSCAELRRLLAEAPALRTLTADAECRAADATSVLAGAPPFGALRLSRLRVRKERRDVNDEARSMLETLVRVLLGQRVEAAPVDDVTAALAASLAANRDVREVEICVSPGPLLSRTAALIRALIGHPSVRALRVVGVGWEDTRAEWGGPEAFGVYPALAELVASDTLQLLSLPSSDNLNAALGALVDALPAARWLRALHASGMNLSGLFVEQRLLPALRANESLRELRLEPALDGDMPPEAQQAMDLIAQRSHLQG
jgi:hypothetical protein